jgi:hypothetical protein
MNASYEMSAKDDRTTTITMTKETYELIMSKNFVSSKLKIQTE